MLRRSIETDLSPKNRTKLNMISDYGKGEEYVERESTHGRRKLSRALKQMEVGRKGRGRGARSGSVSITIYA